MATRNSTASSASTLEGIWAILLLAFLGGGAVAALTWFPMQRPLTAVPLLLAAGRAWRISIAPAVSAPALSTEGRA